MRLSAAGVRAALAALALTSASAAAAPDRDPGPEAAAAVFDCGGIASLTIDGAVMVVEATLEGGGAGWTGAAAVLPEGAGGVVAITLTGPRAAGERTVEMLAELPLPKGVTPGGPWRLRVRGGAAPSEKACVPAA